MLRFWRHPDFVRCRRAEPRTASGRVLDNQKSKGYPKPGSATLLSRFSSCFWVFPQEVFAVGELYRQKEFAEGHATYHLVGAKRKMNVGCAGKERRS